MTYTGIISPSLVSDYFDQRLYQSEKFRDQKGHSWNPSLYNNHHEFLDYTGPVTIQRQRHQPTSFVFTGLWTSYYSKERQNFRINICSKLWFLSYCRCLNMRQAKNFHIVITRCCYMATIWSGEGTGSGETGGSCFEINSPMRPGLPLLAPITEFIVLACQKNSSLLHDAAKLALFDLILQRKRLLCRCQKVSRNDASISF